jgi:hypothetical protein
MNLKKVADLFLSAIKSVLRILVTAFLVMACEDHDVHLPEGYLPQEKMVDLMVDIHLVEGARSGNLLLGDTNALPDYYAHIYKKYGLTAEAFKENFYWYAQNPTEMKAVYEEVIVALNKLEEEVKKVSPDEDVSKLDE